MTIEPERGRLRPAPDSGPGSENELVRQLVFAGCGVKGTGYLGVIRALEQAGVLPGVERVAGTSAGAVMAAMLALGASSDDVDRLVSPLELGPLLSRTPNVSELLSAPWTFGLRDAEPVEEWLRERIAELTEARLGEPRPDLTLGELDTLADLHPGTFRRPYIIATNLSCLRAEVFCGEVTPDETLARAVRYSIGIPAVLKAGTLDDGSVLVDGALTWNYPFQLFSGWSRPPVAPGVRGIKFGTDRPGATLGFVMSSREELGLTGEAASGPHQEIAGVLDFMSSVFMLTTQLATLAYLEPEVRDHTVFVGGEGVSPIDFGLDLEAHQQLMRNGRTQTLAWLERHATAMSSAAPHLEG